MLDEHTQNRIVDALSDLFDMGATPADVIGLMGEAWTYSTEKHSESGQKVIKAARDAIRKQLT